MKKFIFIVYILLGICLCGFSQSSVDTFRIGKKKVEEKPKTTAPIVETIKPPPLAKVDVMPVFPGGEDELYKFLQENIKYPQLAKETNISGTVYIYFVIETDGSVSDVRLVKGIRGGCDEEALRVVKMMPKWSPGRLDGKAVRVSYALPIVFSLINKN